MIAGEETARKTAELLLQIKAIKLSPSAPFRWASGWNSPIYCDNRAVLSYPKIRTYIRQQLAEVTSARFGAPDLIAGVAMGAIAHGALTAQALDLPFVYVRPRPKDHGTGSAIEGVFSAGQSVVVIEDLVSTGRSSLGAVATLRGAGCVVKGMAAIFEYGFRQAEDAFRESECTLYSLCDYETLILHASETEYVNAAQLETLREWRRDPAGWHKTTT